MLLTPLVVINTCNICGAKQSLLTITSNGFNVSLICSGFNVNKITNGLMHYTVMVLMNHASVWCYIALVT